MKYEIRICVCCGKKFGTSVEKQRFCNRSCSAKHRIKTVGMPTPFRFGKSTIEDLKNFKRTI